MTTFVILAIVITLIVLFVLLRPLFKNSHVDTDSLRTEQNISIYNEKLASLAAEKEQNLISQAEFDTFKTELDRTLLNVSEDNMPNHTSSKAVSVTASLFVSVCVISIAYFGYDKLGSYEGITYDKNDRVASSVSSAGKQAASKLPPMEDMVKTLEEKLKANPDNAEGWVMLGRSYNFMQNYQGAANAYAKANKLMPGDSFILTSYAQAIAQVNNNDMTGQPEQLLAQALTVDPNNIQAIWLSGLAARQQGKNQQALDLWLKLRPMVEANDLDTLNSFIASVESDLGISTSVPQPAIANIEPDTSTSSQGVKDVVKTGITVNVSLSDEFIQSTSPDDFVFIFAKAASGPKMPLAAVKKRVSELPVQVVLSDKDAMIPAMAISKFTEIVIGARISKTGQPIPQSGDLQGLSQTMSNMTKDPVTIIINSKI